MNWSEWVAQCKTRAAEAKVTAENNDKKIHWQRDDAGGWEGYWPDSGEHFEVQVLKYDPPYAAGGGFRVLFSSGEFYGGEIGRTNNEEAAKALAEKFFRSGRHQLHYLENHNLADARAFNRKVRWDGHVRGGSSLQGTYFENNKIYDVEICPSYPSRDGFVVYVDSKDIGFLKSEKAAQIHAVRHFETSQHRAPTVSRDDWNKQKSDRKICWAQPTKRHGNAARVGIYFEDGRMHPVEIRNRSSSPAGKIWELATRLGGGAFEVLIGYEPIGRAQNVESAQALASKHFDRGKHRSNTPAQGSSRSR